MKVYVILFIYLFGIRYLSSGSSYEFAACLFLAPRQLWLSDSDPSKTPPLVLRPQAPLTSPQWHSLSHPQDPCPLISPRPPLALCPREVTILTQAPPPLLPSPRPPLSCLSAARSPTASATCPCPRRRSLPCSHLRPSSAWRTVWEEAAWPEGDWGQGMVEAWKAWMLRKTKCWWKSRRWLKNWHGSCIRSRGRWVTISLPVDDIHFWSHLRYRCNKWTQCQRTKLFVFCIVVLRLKSWRCSSTRGNAATEQPRNPSLLHLTPPCTTSRLRPWWASISLGLPSSRSPCPYPPAVLYPPPNSWRTPLAAAWTIWDTAVPPFLIWGAPVGHNVWTPPHLLVAPLQCRLSSVHSAHHKTPQLESLQVALSLRPPITPTCYHLLWGETVVLIPTHKGIIEPAIFRYSVVRDRAITLKWLRCQTIHLK